MLSPSICGEGRKDRGRERGGAVKIETGPGAASSRSVSGHTAIFYLDTQCGILGTAEMASPGNFSETLGWTPDLLSLILQFIMVPMEIMTVVI